MAFTRNRKPMTPLKRELLKIRMRETNATRIKQDAAWITAYDRRAFIKLYDAPPKGERFNWFVHFFLWPDADSVEVKRVVTTGPGVEGRVYLGSVHGAGDFYCHILKDFTAEDYDRSFRALVLNDKVREWLTRFDIWI